MRTVTLFIAMSLDGFIADRNGGVEWLAGQESGKNDMESYDRFIREIDTVILGWNTYAQVTAELSPEGWPYEELHSYVFTHRTRPDTDNIRFVNEDVCAFVRSLRREQGKGIWICGGADVAGQLIRENLIDRYHISVIPTILGDGIRLFDKRETELKLRLLESRSYNGITDLIYERRGIS